MSLKEDLLNTLSDRFKLNVEEIAENLSHVIRGETVTDTYKVNKKDGSLSLYNKRIQRTPQDMLLGLQVVDKLTDGSLGLGSKNIKPEDIRHKQLPINK